MSAENRLNTVKPMVRALFKNILVIFLVLTPIGGYLAVSYIGEMIAPTEKPPYVHWNGLDPSNSVYISWETLEFEPSYIKYGTDLSLSETPIVDATNVKIHHMTLNSLTPNTRYYYKVGSSDTELMENTHTFVTAPVTNVAFNFTIISDTQQLWGTGHYNIIADAIASKNHGDTSFVAYAGDMGQEPDDQQTWNFFLKETAKFSDRMSIVPGLGNHDRDERNPNTMYNKYYNISQYIPSSSVPQKGYYAFNWSNTFFAMMEVAEGGDNNPLDPYNMEHDQWLNASLAAAQDLDHRILIWHRPMYSGAGNNQELIDRFGPIIEKYNVSMAFYGHEHMYERFYVDNVTYICLASGGGLQNLAVWQQPEKEVIAMGASFTRIFIDGPNVVVKTLSPSFDIIDEVHLEKVGSELHLKEGEI